MPPASRILPLLLLTLLPTGCVRRQRIPEHTTLSQQTIPHDLRREPQWDRRGLKAVPQPDGVVTFHTQWQPACLVQDVDHRVVRTRWQPDLPKEAWVRDSMFVVGGLVVGHTIAQADTGYDTSLAALAAGTILVATGATLFGVDAHFTYSKPPEVNQTVSVPLGPPRLDACGEAKILRTLTILLPNATLSAPIDDDGVARVTIPPSVWDASPDGLSTEVRIGPYSFGRVRLVKE